VGQRTLSLFSFAYLATCPTVVAIGRWCHKDDTAITASAKQSQLTAAYGSLHKASSFRPVRQVTTIVAPDISNSALASRIAESTADFLFLRPEISVVTPLRRASQPCFSSLNSTRYSTAAIFRAARFRTPVISLLLVFSIAYAALRSPKVALTLLVATRARRAERK